MLSTVLSTGLQVFLLLMTAACAFACVRAVDGAQRSFRNDRARVSELEERCDKLDTRVKQAHARISQLGLRGREPTVIEGELVEDDELQAMLDLQRAPGAKGA